MGRLKRGGYVFEFWVGDHPPQHVHVFKDRKLFAKIELDENLTLMEGKNDRKIRKILRQFLKEGVLK